MTNDLPRLELTPDPNKNNDFIIFRHPSKGVKSNSITQNLVDNKKHSTKKKESTKRKRSTKKNSSTKRKRSTKKNRSTRKSFFNLFT